MKPIHTVLLTTVAAMALAGAPIASHAQGLGGSLLRSLTAKPAEQQQQQPQQQQPGSGQQEGQSATSRVYLGYSLQFQGLRPLINQGAFADARSVYETGATTTGAPVQLPVQAANPGAAGMSAMFAGLSAQPGAQPEAGSAGNVQPLLQKTPTFLNFAEIGTLHLDAGAVEAARTSFDSAGGAIAQAAGQKEKSGIGGAMRSLGRVAASAAGNAELGAYDPPDYERVLQLNYLSLTYLLLGDDKAFNVSKRASERQRDAFESLNDKATRLQDEAREKFEAERAEAKKKLAEATENPDQAGQSTGVSGQLAKAYGTGETCKAPNLPSAYINPLGFFLNGVVYEVSSAQYPEDVETARIAYQKAFALAPRSATLDQAVRELNSDKIRPGRLLHVIVGEGAAPTRQAIQTQLTIGTTTAPITIPRLTCYPSAVASIEVRTTDGKRLAVLDPMADIEGMMLQRQKDREPLTAAAVVTNVMRSAMETRAAQNNAVLGILAAAKQSAFDRPDMRSWSSLPARMHVARVYAPKEATEVDIVSLDAKGAKIASNRVALDTKSKQNVIYARASDGDINAAPVAKLWIQTP